MERWITAWMTRLQKIHTQWTQHPAQLTITVVMVFANAYSAVMAAISLIFGALFWLNAEGVCNSPDVEVYPAIATLSVPGILICAYLIFINLPYIESRQLRLTLSQARHDALLEAKQPLQQTQVIVSTKLENLESAFIETRTYQSLTQPARKRRRCRLVLQFRSREVPFGGWHRLGLKQRWACALINRYLNSSRRTGQRRDYRLQDSTLRCGGYVMFQVYTILVLVGGMVYFYSIPTFICWRYIDLG